MSEPDAPGPLETMLNEILDAEPILEDPHLDPALLSAFTTDVAEDIDPPENIARRYGFRDGPHMIEFIRKNRGITKIIKAKRAVFSANHNIETVNRKKANFVISESMAVMSAPLFDPKVPAGVRLDTFKAFSRMAGIDGVAAGSVPGQVGAAGAGFTVNFLFSGQPTQTITTVVDVSPDETTEAPSIMPTLLPLEPEV